MNERGVTAVVGGEARGFLLGGAVAIQLGAGFHAVRKAGSQLTRYSWLMTGRNVGHRHLLSKELVERSGATFLGLTVIVDQLTDEVRLRLSEVTSLLQAGDLEADQ